MIMKQLRWAFIYGHTDDNFHLLSVFLHSSYHLIMKYSAFTTNLLKTLFFLTLLVLLCAFLGAHLDIKKFKVLLRTSVYYHKGMKAIQVSENLDIRIQHQGILVL